MTYSLFEYARDNVDKMMEDVQELQEPQVLDDV